MPSPAVRPLSTLPEPVVEAEGLLPASLPAAEVEADFAARFERLDSPAARMQWELYQRFSAERHSPAIRPYPVPLRLCLMVGGAVASWGGLFWLSHTLLSQFG